MASVEHVEWYHPAGRLATLTSRIFHKLFAFKTLCHTLFLRPGYFRAVKCLSRLIIGLIRVEGIAWTIG